KEKDAGREDKGQEAEKFRPPVGNGVEAGADCLVDRYFGIVSHGALRGRFSSINTTKMMRSLAGGVRANMAHHERPRTAAQLSPRAQRHVARLGGQRPG